MEDQITIFSTNLKREIKKQGYKIGEFAPNQLGMSVPTFTKKCKDGTFTIVDLIRIEGALSVSYERLMAKVDGVQYSRNFLAPKKLRGKSSKNGNDCDPPKNDDKKQSDHGSKDLSYLKDIM